MRKEIKQWGSSAVIVLTKEDLKLYDFQVGDHVDCIIDIINIKKKVRK